MAISKEEVRERLTKAAFGNGVVSNIYRGLVAEVIVESALSTEWERCSADWAGWDFIHINGSKLEVKQSAARQTWSTGRRTSSVFGIAPSKGYFSGDKWTPKPGRQSSIYVFAHHDGIDLQSIHHLDPLQWRFYVIPTDNLPKTRTIGLSTLVKLSDQIWSQIDVNRKFPCDIYSLGDSVEFVRNRLEAASPP